MHRVSLTGAFLAAALAGAAAAGPALDPGESRARLGAIGAEADRLERLEPGRREAGLRRLERRLRRLERDARARTGPQTDTRDAEIDRLRRRLDRLERAPAALARPRRPYPRRSRILTPTLPEIALPPGFGEPADP